MVHDPFYETLRAELVDSIGSGHRRIAFWGFNSTAVRLAGQLSSMGLSSALVAVVDERDELKGTSLLNVLVDEPRCLVDVPLDVVVITVDASKEAALQQLNQYVPPNSRIIIAGVKHLEFHDPLFHELVNSLFIPPRAAGYPLMLVHLFQSLRYLATRHVSGAFAEFGVYKGGTTVFLARTLERLGIDACIYAFDTFAGFPGRRSVLDLYSSSHDEFADYEAVRRYCQPYRIELIKGDISETYTAIKGVPLAASFFDADNYSPTRAALGMCAEQTVPGGIVAFDHYYCDERWLYTLGERIAIDEILGTADGFFHLHGTGVFLKL